MNKYYTIYFFFTQKLLLTFFWYVLGSVLTAIYLAAYIVDLILVLHEVSKVTMATLDPPKCLSKDIVMDVVATYKSTTSSRIHVQVKEVAASYKVEEKPASVIRNAL